MTEFLRRFPLPVIVLAQLFGTSLWFSVNGVWLSFSRELGLGEPELGWMTLAVQAGFISGTLTLAVTGLADRFGASRIFALASVLGAVINAGFVLVAEHLPAALLLRFVTGLCLAGIYPLGMKMVIAWTPSHAGAALAWLVGMLTLGTALPHLMRGATLGMPWQWPLLGASMLAVVGGLLVLRLGDGPHLPKNAGRLGLKQGLAALAVPRFRAVAGGYIGHMWELYAFWMLVPLLVARELERLGRSEQLVPWLSFAIIAVGFVGCVLGGRLSRHLGSDWVARRALATSGLVCLCYPWLSGMPPVVLLVLLFIWGLAVIADSPQFSALAAATAPPQLVGSSLSVMNAVGFGVTLPAILLVSSLWEAQTTWVVLWLLPGPILGLIAFRGLRPQPSP
ncbi:MFS transporter [Marinobacter salinisoli]|uniref:MFS transporter n=1 Tax=Marinobacter salinisoli TaxID=2769486 RepID=A0ABX7MUZ1_9GAMM|nr:MFS transporter [Marinobacter salinisoli]QSP95312.1 MFS transporter [Marinobacter salinisoli]